MRSVLIACAAFGLMACEGLTGNGSGITEDDIKNIEEGDANGVIFSGSWDLKTEVAESTCGGLLDFLPAKGDTGEESVTFAQTGGKLTKVFDSLGDAYEFNGAVNADGSFIYGSYYDITLAGVSLKQVELVRGTVELVDGGKATMTGTAERRYQGGVIDCSATVNITGERGGLTE